MIFFHDKIKLLGPRTKWNRKPMDESDFYTMCRRFKVRVSEMPLRVDGFYYCVKGKHQIAIDSRLDGIKKLFTMFHEFGHFLRHVPDTNTTANFSGVGEKTAKECEADLFAACALISKPWVESKTVTELIEDEYLPGELVNLRLEIYKSKGI